MGRKGKRWRGREGRIGEGEGGGRWIKDGVRGVKKE